LFSQTILFLRCKLTHWLSDCKSFEDIGLHKNNLLVKSSGIRILWKSCIIRSFGLIWITQPSPCGTRTTACIWTELRLFRKSFWNRVVYARMDLRYWTTAVPFDWFRWFEFKWCYLVIFSDEFISDVLGCKLDCPIILSSWINHGMNEPFWARIFLNLVGAVTVLG
jgi:hypothetical protein